MCFPTEQFYPTPFTCYERCDLAEETFSSGRVARWRLCAWVICRLHLLPLQTEAGFLCGPVCNGSSLPALAMLGSDMGIASPVQTPLQFPQAPGWVLPVWGSISRAAGDATPVMPPGPHRPQELPQV